MDKNKVIMFGASKMGEAAYLLLKDKYNIINFADNDENKWGKKLCDLKIISPEEIKKEKLDSKVIIASMYFEDIIKQLNEMQIKDIEVFNFELNNIKQVEYDKENYEFIKDFIDKVNLNDKNKSNLHIMIDNFYTKRFIKFINENFKCEEHKFIILATEKLRFVDDLESYGNAEIIYIGKYADLRLYSMIKKSKKVFIHYLTDYMCKFICDYEINKCAEINWIIWGGDLYANVDIELYNEKTKEFIKGKYDEFSFSDSYMNLSNYKFRAEAIKRTKCFLTNKGDYEVLRNFFETEGEYKKAFYPNPVDFENLNKCSISSDNSVFRFKDKYKYVIQLGNSGAITNNHLDILYKLQKLKSENFCVICPLSYGNKEYIIDIVKKGKELLGERFIPITEFLEPDKYFNLLTQVDVSIMAHNRQQGFGNLLILLYLGKKVFLNNKVSTYALLEECNIRTFSMELIDNKSIEELCELDEEIRINNKKNVLNNFNIKRCKSYWRRIFSDDN